MRSARFASVLALVVLLMIAGRASAQPADAIPGAAPQRLRVACYNLENMFDVFDDPFTKDEDEKPKSREQIEQIAKALRTLDADVVTFSEVENEAILRAMVHEMLGDRGYNYIAVLPTNSDRGINLGVISRRPIVALTTHRFAELRLPGQENKWRLARDVLRVEVQATESRTLTVLAVHFKSRITAGADKNSVNWRLAEATFVKGLVDKALAADPAAWVVVQGDFNDTPGDPSISKLLEPTANGAAMVDVCAGLPPEKRITYLRKPYRDRGPIDYILASPDLAKRIVEGSARPLDDEALLGGSDHAPVTVEFDLK